MKLLTLYLACFSLSCFDTHCFGSLWQGGGPQDSARGSVSCRALVMPGLAVRPRHRRLFVENRILYHPLRSRRAGKSGHRSLQCLLSPYRACVSDPRGVTTLKLNKCKSPSTTSPETIFLTNIWELEAASVYRL